MVAMQASIAASDAAPDAAAPSSTPRGQGILELNSRETVLTLGGRVAADMTVNTPGGSTTTPRNAPLEGAGSDDGLRMHLRDSRVWLKTRTPTGRGTVRSLIEADFNGAGGSETTSNGYGLRLRHAFLQVGEWMVGQNWSTFLPEVTADTIVDPVSMSWIRQPQLRWTRRYGRQAFSVAAENPETTLTTSSGSGVTPGDDAWPDLVGRVSTDTTWGRASAAGLVRRLRREFVVDDGSAAPEQRVAQAWAWGTSASVQWPLFRGDDLRMTIVYGDGVGRYAANNAFDAGLVDERGRIRLVTARGGSLAYRHWWSRDWRSTFAVSVAVADAGAATLPAKANRRLGGYQANLFWTPIDQGLVGIECAYLEREHVDGESSRTPRIYMRTLYNF